MPTQPRIACVVPVFNGERYLASAIRSVLEQTAGDFAVIVVDDGSTDGTREVATGFGRNVHYVHQANSGPASARNRGIELARSEFVAFMDADDIWLPSKTEVQLRRFTERRELIACTSHIQNFVSEDAPDRLGELADPHPEQGQPGVSSSFMARSGLFESVGLLNPQYRHRDLQDLLVRATDRGLAVETLPQILVRRRIHATNMSRSRDGADQLELLAITRARLARRRAVGA